MSLQLFAVGLWCWPNPARDRIARRSRVRAMSWRWSMFAGVAVLCCWMCCFLNVGSLVATILVSWTLWDRLRARRRAVDRAAGAASLGEALRAMVVELRRGAHPGVAAATVRQHGGGDVAGMLAAIEVSVRIGAPVVSAVAACTRRAPHLAREIDRIALGWQLSSTHGVPLTQSLSVVVRDLEYRHRCGARVRAQAAGVRASGVVLGLLPVLGVGLGELIGAHPLRFLTGDALGGVFLVVGVALVCLGLRWTASLTDKVCP